MSVRQYIGSRYVPIFADPLEWNGTRTYEQLTVVLHQGNSYTSRQPVPAGIEITNTTYWAQTGNYSAQVEQYRQETEQYRQEVASFDGRITANETAIAAETSAREAADTALGTRIDANASAISTEATARADADTALGERIDANASAITAEATARADADTALGGRIDEITKSDPIYYGADPTGVTDSTTAIQAAINANKGESVSFTPGKYKISAAIETPWPFADRVSLYGNGAVLFASEAIDAAFKIGNIDNPVDDSQNNYTKGFNAVENFIVDGTNIETGVIVTRFTQAVRIFGMNLQGCKNGINIYPTNDGSGSSDTEILNCVIVGRGESEAGSFGVRFGGSDSKITGCRIYKFESGCLALGAGNFYSNVHWVKNYYSIKTTYCDDIVNNCFFDSQKVGIYQSGSADTTCRVTNCRFLNDSGYDYAWFDFSNHVTGKCAPVITDNIFGFSAPAANQGATGMKLPTTLTNVHSTMFLGLSNIEHNIISTDANYVNVYDPLFMFSNANEYQQTYSGFTFTANTWYKVGAFFITSGLSATVRFSIATKQLEVEVNAGSGPIAPVVIQNLNSFPSCSIGSKSIQVAGELYYCEVYLKFASNTTGWYGMDIVNALTLTSPSA